MQKLRCARLVNVFCASVEACQEATRDAKTQLASWRGALLKRFSRDKIYHLPKLYLFLGGIFGDFWRCFSHNSLTRLHHGHVSRGCPQSPPPAVAPPPANELNRMRAALPHTTAPSHTTVQSLRPHPSTQRHILLKLNIYLRAASQRLYYNIETKYHRPGHL